MTNTSRIGASYENRYRRWLETERNLHVTRSAASKGAFDLIAYDAWHCFHVQLKASYISCRASSTLARSLAVSVQDPYCKTVVVHAARHAGGLEFCEHVG